jgi:signal transduction histidine kinase
MNESTKPSYLERILVPAASNKSLTIPVMLMTSFLSVLVHLFASSDLGLRDIGLRVIAAVLSVLPMFGFLWIVHRINFPGTGLRVAVVFSSYLLAGALRGFFLSLMLIQFGVLDGFDWAARIFTSTISMSITLGIVTYAWTTYRNHADALAELRLETEQLTSALSQLEVEKNAEALRHISDVSSKIVGELEKIRLNPASEQRNAIQKVVDDFVRPLSKKFANEIKNWEPAKTHKPATKFRITFLSLNPVSNLPSLWFAVAISLTPFPNVYSEFGLVKAVEISLFTALALIPGILIGFGFARRFIPRLKTPKREIVLTLIFELIAVPGVTATYIVLQDTPLATSYVLGGLITFPIYAWILSIVGALLVDLRTKEATLQKINRDLGWAIARINLLSWYNQGVVTRLLHGPIQNSLHATLIKLRNQESQVVVDKLVEELKSRISTVNPLVASGSRSETDIRESLLEIGELWSGIAAVRITTTTEAIQSLISDSPAAAIVIDLCNEFCSNSIRHGKANFVEISIDAEPSEIKMIVRDNGETPKASSGLGLGTRFLTNCSISWGSKRYIEENILTVLLPSTNTDESLSK